MVDRRTSRSDATRRTQPPKQRIVAPPPLIADRRAHTPRPPARELGEVAVRVAGVGLAVVSTAFAAYMISDTERRPQFAGLEHLAIYSRPATIASKRIQMQVAEQRSKVDFTPVGSIGEQKETSVPGFTLLSVRSGVGLLQTPTAILEVLPGDMVEGLGRVTAYERRGDKWALVATSGVVLAK